MNREDIAKVIQREPRLTSHGLGIFHYPGQKPPSHHSLYQAFLAEQEELLNAEKKCTAICAWLTGVVTRKTINSKVGSYGLKHLCEREIGQYVTNGELIAACIHMGLTFTQEGFRSPNVCFNISSSTVFPGNSELPFI
jgi:hypothetical protein